ncbi:36.4 kDa proline-rich protein-like [Musa acuminata AAA Group]|uniref:(wild Malaysian banana) hypothetical protein n=1 Tax=Musa acuminata subsp. malaccensis TaxID=214687 RepID=A0A804HYU5_MUSAM|nr:PREDICTED: 36.4 kDa proline-rich protein-like [Musa acuminata subsp. malaccensis]CAG1860980.1 unnamed protein product [Musa acuminata subsp. malaccensis]
MEMYHVAVLLLLAHFASFPHSLACPYCSTPTTPPKQSPPPPPPPSPCPPPPRSVGPVPPSPKTPSPPSSGTCPIDTLKLDACVDLLGGLVHAVIGQDTQDKCCPVIQGLADLDAALCLCTTIKAKALDINVLLPIALELLVDCGKHVPSDYQCPA